MNATLTNRQCLPPTFRETNGTISDNKLGEGWRGSGGGAGHLRFRGDDPGKILSEISSTSYTLNKCDQLVVVAIVGAVSPSACFCL